MVPCFYKVFGDYINNDGLMMYQEGHGREPFHLQRKTALNTLSQGNCLLFQKASLSGYLGLPVDSHSSLAH